MRSLLLLIPCLLLGASAARAQNVVVIVLDDVGVDRVGAYGHATAGPTPQIDALAQQGVLFRHFWAYPTCSPFRASALTGTHPERHGVGAAIQSTGANPDHYLGLDVATPNVVHVLKANGYRTAAVGKWHVAGVDQTPSHPLEAGFDYHAGSMGNPQRSMTGVEATGYYQWEKCVNGSCSQSTTYITTDTTDEAIGQLSGSEPFFLWVAYNAAHAPFHDPPADLHSYDGQCSCCPFPGATCHKAAIEAMDSEIGRLLAELDLSDTTVLVTADNGSPRESVETPFRNTQAKGTVYEGGINVPLVVAGEVVATSASGRESQALVQATDLFSTILAIAEVPASAKDSVSFLPLLVDPDLPSARAWVFAEKFVPNGGPPEPADTWRRAVRDERYKLIRSGVGSSSDEFFDLEVDPMEDSPLDLVALTDSERASLETLKQVIELPEPGRGWLLAIGIAFVELVGRRRRRSKSRPSRPIAGRPRLAPAGPPSSGAAWLDDIR